MRGDKNLPVGDMGLNEIKMPIFNKDVPADASLADIIVVGSEKDEAVTTTPFKSWGNLAEYKFPEYCENQNVCGPDSKVSTNHVFDISMEGEMHDLPDNVSNDITPTGSGPNESGAYLTSQGTWQFGILGGPKTNVRRSYAVVVVPTSRQKEFGDWVANNSIAPGASSNPGDLDLADGNLTAWQFDDFCDKVRPIFARHYYWKTDKVYNKDTFATSQFDRPNPYSSETLMSGRYLYREFHLKQGFANCTPVDFYGSRLLMGTLGQYGLGIFSFLRFNVMYKKVRVCASDLYWANTRQKDLKGLIQNGSRVEYGRPDWALTAPDRGDNGDVGFKGVMTCSIGNVGLFAGGKLKAGADPTNILQDTASEQGGDWY